MAGWLLGWHGDGNGDPCSHPLGLAGVLHEGTLRFRVVLDFERGLEPEFPRRGPNLLGGLVSSVIFLP